MRRLAIYGWSLSAGIIGFAVIAVAGIAVAKLEQPALTTAVTAASTVFAIGSTAAIASLVKAATPAAANAMAVVGMVLVLLTQLFYWNFLIH